jgi:hypothetical protein
MNYHFIPETNDAEDVWAEDIAESSNFQELSNWFTSWTELHSEISADVESYRFVGTADDQWLKRCGGKLAALRKGIRAVENRMLSINMTPPYPPKDPRINHIRRLEDKCLRYKKVLKENGINVDDI